MAYRVSKYGNIIKVDNEIILVPMEETSSLYQEYLQFLTAGGTVEISELFTEEEEIAFNTPTEVALWKLRFVLAQMGLEQYVTNGLASLPEPQRTAATYIWNYGNSVDRHSNTITFLQGYLSLSNFQVNQIFVEANTITL